MRAGSIINKQTIEISGRRCTVFADSSPQYLLIQPADERELEMLDREAEHIKALTNRPFLLVAVEITDWNSQLSPWPAPPVFGNEAFGSGAGITLACIEHEILPQIEAHYSLNEDIPVILGGYSLAGLFALWAAYNSELFSAAAGVSPSVWFSGWDEYIEKRSPAAECVYLSLGKKEEKARNKIMSTVGDNIRRQLEFLVSNNIPTILEWNEGNHFTEPELRTAKGFAWCINNLCRK